MSAETPKSETKPREPVPESNTIRVRVPRRLSYEQIREYFKDCGTITRMRYITRFGTAFIQLADVAAAKAAIERYNQKVWKVVPAHARDQKELEWRIDAGFARPATNTKRPAARPSKRPAARRPSRFGGRRQNRKSDVEVAVLHLPLVVEEADVKQIFEGFEIVSIDMPDPRKNARDRHAFVKFPSHEVQQKAIAEVNKTTVEESTIIVEPRRVSGERKPAEKPKTPAPAPQPNESVFIQVPRYTTHEQVKDDLLKDFKDYKLYLRTRLFRRPPLCFVTFDSVEAAQKCIDSITDKAWKFIPGSADKGKEIDWKVKASFARPRRNKEAKAETPK